MKKKLTLWILLSPALLLAQVEMKNGSLSIDFSKKKQKQEQIDTTKQQQIQEDEEEKPAKTKKTKAARAKTEEEDAPDFKREGLFKALFMAGVNLSQVDGDEQAGYVYPGAHGGVGVMIKFHKYLSASAEILYSMKGAYQKANANSYPQRSFRIQWDYMEVPLLFNVHDKKLVIATAGLSLGYLVREKLTYRVSDASGTLRDTIPLYPYSAPTKKFDLNVVLGFQFLIKKVLGIGARFEYSLIGLKPAALNTKVNQMHNNSITLRLMYILDPVALKKKKH